MIGLCQSQTLVPFFSDYHYSRDEPTDPPWFVFNNLQPSKLYYDGVYQSEETGTNDLNIRAVWALGIVGAKVGIVDQTAHGDRIQSIVSTVSTNCPIYRYELSRWDEIDVAYAIQACVQNGCRVISVTTGFANPNSFLSNSCWFAFINNVVICCALPNIDGDLDSTMVDYPYEWSRKMPNILGVSSTDRNGYHYSPSATGTNAIGAPGRNIVGAGTYSSGTSWATGIAAGCVSLLIGRYPGQQSDAYTYAVKITGSEPDRRIDPLSCIQLPVPYVSISSNALVVEGLYNWNYMVERSEDLKSWTSIESVFGKNSIEIVLGFYRARVM